MPGPNPDLDPDTGAGFRPPPYPIVDVDPGVAAAELVSMIQARAARHPRSLQTAIGPSEIGSPCDRKLGHKLAGTPAKTDAAWWQVVGTAIHAHLEQWFADTDPADYAAHIQTWARGLNRSWPDLLGGHPRFYTEPELHVGSVGGQPITGHSDLYDRLTAISWDWKGLKLSTPLPTPAGWTTIGAIGVGDQVFDRHGAVCRVTGKSPVFARDCYRIVLEDGTVAVADNVHEWVVQVGHHNNKVEKIMTTEEMADYRSTRYPGVLRIPVAEALDLPDIDLPVNPYVLGVWLGDGDSCSGLVCKPDDDLFANITAEGFAVGPPDRICGVRRCVHGLTRILTSAGLIQNKHIPDIYLRASIRQRLALLQGLMDTDGMWNRRRNQAVFSSTNKNLADGVLELAHSLGFPGKSFELTKHGFGLTTTCWDVAVTPNDMNPFRLPRKANLARTTGSRRSRRRAIRSIEPVPTVPTQCIEVDSTDRTYLCTEQMIPTHNCVGPASLRTTRQHGPSATYRAQAHLYGLGWENAGMPIRHVGIMCLPRNGVLSDHVAWTEPYDRQHALDALTRLNSIQQVLDRFGTDALAVLPRADDYCESCPFHRPRMDSPEAGCPGATPDTGPRSHPSGPGPSGTDQILDLI